LRSYEFHSAHEADIARLAAHTQLRHLSFYTWTNASSKGLEHLSSVTQLTSLKFHGWLTERTGTERDTAEMVQRRLEVQSQLGSALLSLPQLQQLELAHIPSGPVTDALAKLTALTKLVCWVKQVGENHTWSLPSVQVLICDLTWQQLAGLRAPQLRRLAGASPSYHLHQTCSQTQQLPPPGPEARLAAARGPLRWCNNVVLHWSSWSPEVVTEWLGSLGEAWQPDPSVMQPNSGSGLPEWKLQLWDFRSPLVGATLALLPSGLTHLNIR
jgi:hypothetical protein